MPPWYTGRGDATCCRERDNRGRRAVCEARRLRARAPALAAVSIALGIGEGTQPWLGNQSANLVFLTAVVGVAARYGLGPSLFASIVASLARDSRYQ